MLDTDLCFDGCICRESWENIELERAYTVFLDVVLLLIPLFLMTGSYTNIMKTLCVGIHQDFNNSPGIELGISSSVLCI